MTTEQFTAWLTQWLSRHPVKSPDASTRATYTQDVMSRIEALSTAPSPARWRMRVSWSLALGGALAAAAVLLVIVRHPDTQVARLAPSHATQVLAQVLSQAGEDPAEVLAEMEAEDASAVAEELIAVDRLMLAEASKPTNAIQAIWQELDTLDTLDDSDGPGAAADLTGDDASENNSDEVLEELEWIDSASATSS